MFDDIIQQAAETYQVPESWIRAVIQTESSWNPSAYRAEPQIGDASYGLMQLLSKTANGLGFTGDPSELYDPEKNIPLGTALIAQIRQRVGEDFQAMYSAYNSGSPTKYLTSSQVASNVARAVVALEKYVTDDVGALTGGGGSAVLIVLVLLWFWTKKKK
jgi:soluble lytic murein transglycosylase-like protein